MNSITELQKPFSTIYGFEHDYLVAEAKKVQETKTNGKHTYREMFYEFFDEYQDYYINQRKSPKTLADIESTNRLYVLKEKLPYESIADTYIEDLTPGNVKKFKRSILDYNSGKGDDPKKSLSHQRLKNIILYIDKVFQYAYDQGYLSKAFIEDIKITQVRGKPQKSKASVRNFFSKKEFDEFMQIFDEKAFEYFKGNEEIRVSKLHQIKRDICPVATFRCLLYRAYFSILFYTGLRKNEARGLLWSDLFEPKDNVPLHLIRIEKQYTDKFKKYLNEEHDFKRDPKTPSSIRLCYLHNNCTNDLNALRQYLISTNQYDINKCIFHDFYVRNPKTIPETNLDRCFNYLKKISMIEKNSISLGNIARHITIHGLRHSACTMLLEQGMEKADVASFLGHSNTKMVEYVYNHYIQPSDMLESILAMNLKYFT